MFAIEKDIEIPKRNWSSAGREKIYPFDEMELGDSFFVPCETISLSRLKQVSIKGSARRLKDAGKLFETRAMDGGVRCWRTK